MRFKLTLFCTLFLLFLTVGCLRQNVHGPLIALQKDGIFSIQIKKEKIQKSLNALLEPSGKSFQIAHMSIIQIEGKHFLSLKGNQNVRCLVALEETNDSLYELNDDQIPIVVCSGCAEACLPELTSQGWVCKGCNDCEKSQTISDHFVFE